MRPAVEEIAHLRLRPAGSERRSHPVVVEEPLETRLDGASVAVTMRTPGHDAELALGFLVTEGVVEDPRVVTSIEVCEDNPNVVEVRCEPGAAGVHAPAARHFFSSSSCGICGKATLAAVRVRAPRLEGDRSRLGARLLAELPSRLLPEQRLFQATGSLHAAGLFDLAGQLLCAREDVGRHNAVDKVVGWAALTERLPLSGHVLLVSGRLGFEIAQKALVAGIPIVAAISGPSSLAVELAREAGMTLVGFLRQGEMNVYSGEARISLP